MEDRKKIFADIKEENNKEMRELDHRLNVKETNVNRQFKELKVECNRNRYKKR